MSAEKKFPEDLPMWGDQKNTVAEVRSFLDMLGAPDRAFRVVHVAGTNGKGSVCAYLTQALMDAGVRTGTFISPHLVSVRERIQLNRVPVSAEVFSDAAERVKRAGERWEKAGGIFPSYFEYLYYMAMLIFREAGVEFAVLETGLGGRLDATNSCSPVLTVITSISLDHMQYLGDTVEKIAAEKAGIIKPGIPVIYDRNDSRAEAVILEKARREGSAAFAVAHGETGRYAFLPAPYMRQNAALAERSFEELKKLLPPERRTDFAESVRRTRWEGRMEEVLPDVFADGGHNEDGVRAMTEAARILCGRRGKRPVLLTSAVGDKDLSRVIGRFSEGLKPVRVYLAPLSSGRAADPSRMEELYRENGAGDLRMFRAVPEALRAALAEKKEDEILFIAGSLYLVGEVLEELRGRE